MNLLFVHNHLARGGTEKVMYNLARSLGARGHAVRIAAGDGAWRSCFEAAGLTWIPLDYGLDRGLVSQARRLWSNARALFLACAQQKPDCVVVHGRFMLPAAVLAARRWGLPLVFYAHSDYGGYFPTAARKVIAVSEAASRSGGKNTVVIHNGVEDLFLHFEDGHATVDVLCIARLEKDKGLDDVLKALSLPAMAELHPKVKIVGEGGCRAHLEGLARRFGLDGQVDFSGPVDSLGGDHHAHFAALLASARVVIIPSVRREGFSLVKAEAMSAGRPVIATRVGGLAEGVEDEINGFLVPPRDPAALAVALRRILTDGPIRAVMGRKARETWEKRFTLDAMTTAVEKELRSCTKGKP